MYASVMHSSSDPGGGWHVMATEGVVVWGISPLVVVYSDAQGTSLVGVFVVYGIVSIAGMGVAQVVAVLWCRPPKEGVRPRSDPDTVIRC